MMRWYRKLAAVGLFLLSPSSALAQGCAMCYTSASAANPAAQKALDHAILVLLVPVLVLFVSILAFLHYRLRAREMDANLVPLRAAGPNSPAVLVPGHSR